MACIRWAPDIRVEAERAAAAGAVPPRRMPTSKTTGSPQGAWGVGLGSRAACGMGILRSVDFGLLRLLIGAGNEFLERVSRNVDQLRKRRKDSKDEGNR